MKKLPPLLKLLFLFIFPLNVVSEAYLICEPQSMFDTSWTFIKILDEWSIDESNKGASGQVCSVNDNFLQDWNDQTEVISGNNSFSLEEFTGDSNLFCHDASRNLTMYSWKNHEDIWKWDYSLKRQRSGLPNHMESYEKKDGLHLHTTGVLGMKVRHYESSWCEKKGKQEFIDEYNSKVKSREDRNKKTIQQKESETEI